MPKSLVDIKGFPELEKKLKRLPDKVKRRELLRLQAQAAKPAIAAAKSLVKVGTKPHKIVSRRQGTRIVNPGNLRDSIGHIIAKRGHARVNAVLHVGPKAKGKWMGWYGHILEYGHNIYSKGFKRSKKGGSSGKKHNLKGAKTRVPAKPFMKPAFKLTKGKITADHEKLVARYIQRQIKRLSK